MNWVDLTALGILAVSGIFGLSRGLVREVLSIGAWIGAALVSVYLLPMAEPIAAKQISDSNIAYVAAYGVPFVVALAVLWLVARRISLWVRGSALGGLDRTFGLAFGLARGAVLLAIAYILVGVVQPVTFWPPAILEARSLTLIYSLAVWTAEHVPPEHRPPVQAPPAGRTTTADALMRVSPAGSALRPRTTP